MIRTLTVGTHRTNTFAVECLNYKKQPIRLECYLFQHGDEYHVINPGTCLKSHYSADDRANINRINTETPVRSGDTVEINGRKFSVKVLGQYSDPCVLTAI